MEKITVDPRISGARKMLEKITNIVPVMSSKGGVGKTLFSTILSLTLSSMGYKTGLLDLDVRDPNTHIVLGIDPRTITPREDKGIQPPNIYGLRYMTVEFYGKGLPMPLRGKEADNAILEILSITNWGELDYLIVDTPPGLGDEVMDTIEFFPNPQPILITTPATLSIRSTLKLENLLLEEGVREYMLVVNMHRGEIVRGFKRKPVGYLRYDPQVDSMIGYPTRLMHTAFASDVSFVARKIVNSMS